MLSYYYRNWETLIDPYNIKQRLVKFLETVGLLKFVLKTKRKIFFRLEELQKG
jgi:hypothetical protein